MTLSRKLYSMLALMLVVTAVLAQPHMVQATVDLNSASAAELESLPGIGKTLAAAIVQYRTENGAFKSINDLTRIKGVTDSIFNKIKDMITIGAAGPGPGSVNTEPVRTEPEMTVDEVLAKFKDEPGIKDIQQAAANYAMIYPHEVARWRSGAKNQALFPQFKLSSSVDVNHGESDTIKNNIDITDSGVIIGPDALSNDESRADNWTFGADMTWKLNEYVFNSDMLRVRKESEDMVQLRQDVLNDVTKLYFDRRRLQVDVLIHPPKTIDEQMRNELRLEELTGNIDAMTGGYLTAHLQKKQ